MKNYELSPISRPGGKQKNRVKNDRNNFEIPALLSCEWGNPEWEN